MITKNFKFILPLSIFVALLIFFWFGLSGAHPPLPSNLIDKSLPHFVLPDLLDDTKVVDTHLFHGQVSLLTVWASWCLECQAEQPFLLRLARDKQVNLYGLNYRDDRTDALNWLKQYGNPFAAIGFDDTGETAIDLGVYGTPETFLIDKKGVVRYRVIGSLTDSIWQTKLNPLITELKNEKWIQSSSSFLNQVQDKL